MSGERETGGTVEPDRTVGDAGRRVLAFADELGITPAKLILLLEKYDLHISDGPAHSGRGRTDD